MTSRGIIWIPGQLFFQSARREYLEQSSKYRGLCKFVEQLQKSPGWLYRAMHVKASSAYRARHHQVSSIKYWAAQQSISCRTKKAVVGVIQLITALVSIRSSITFLADMYSFLDPPSRTVLFSVDDRSLFQSIVWLAWFAWSVSADLLYSVRLAVRWLLVKARFVLDSTSVLFHV